MAKESLWETNEDLEVGGVWIDGPGDFKIKVGRIGNTKYDAYLAKIGKSVRMKARHSDVKGKAVEDLAKRAIARYVILDWKNLVDDEGNDVPCSEEKALQMLRDHREFYRFILEAANDELLFKNEEDEDTEGNSEAASSGS